jgi:hypothetical protein
MCAYAHMHDRMRMFDDHDIDDIDHDHVYDFRVYMARIRFIYVRAHARMHIQNCDRDISTFLAKAGCT